MQCPLPLVKVMMLPPSPLYFSLCLCFSLSHCCPHIKLHLTSISVKETGASGSCPITTQRLFPPCLPYPAIPPILCSLQSPFSDLPCSVPHFHPDKTSRSCRKLLHLGSRVHLWRNGSVLAAHGIPLDSQLFTWPLIYALLKRPHATEQVIVHVVKKGRAHSLSL